MEKRAPVTIASGATWQEVAADMQRHRAETLAALHSPLPALPEQIVQLSDKSGLPASLLTPDELAITNANVEDLVPKLATGSMTSVDVTRAFLRRAALAQELSNCVTELLPSQALKRAAELDEYLAANKKVVGPLHGLPVSVKEHVGMKRLDLNAGFVSWVGRVAEDDALILKILWDAGAVFYVRTTQPQTLMHLETANNIYGVTVNPFNSTLTAGGSSGGEGAIVGVRGSVLGVGTDIGGSIRSPAANNGVFGFKPTAGRLPVSGWSASMAGADSILGTIGPLSTSLEGVKLFVKTILDGKPWLREPSLVALPWRDDKKEESSGRKKLRVGVIQSDGVVRPHPPVWNALKSVIETLARSDRVELVEWKPEGHDRAWKFISSLYFCDGGAEEAAAINSSGEPWMEMSKWIIKENPNVREHTIPTLWKAHQDRDNYRTQYAELWNERDVDVILCPAGPGVAPKLNTARYWGYTSQWNLLNYPAIVFPTGTFVGGDKTGGGQDDYPENYEPISDADRYNYELWKKHGVEGYKGAPVSLQLVGRM
ncbi:amidase signature domain-containing protein [Xylariaceae sp. FL0594]|nr:amidase signature domain-containing protein [Xylariaceae sp. FL0594]